MLSLSGISVSQGTSYWEKEDYYFKNSYNEIISGKEFWSLSDKVNFDEFNGAVNERIMETGGSIRGDDKIAEDLTFSAPKSISIIAAINENERDKIFTAHRDAVEKTIEFIKNSNMIQTRDETLSPTLANNDSILAVRIDHFTSRSGDPQLHSHVLIANTVERTSDGKLTATYMKEIYDNKKLLGNIYRQELASQIEKLGYSIEWKKDGTFEVSGFTKEQIKEFSTRRTQIEQKLNELGFSGETGKAAELAALETREAKKEFDIQELENNWKEKAFALNIDISNLKHEKNYSENDILAEKIKTDTIIKETIRETILTQGYLKEHEIIINSAKNLSQNGITLSLDEIQLKVNEQLFKYFSEKGYVYLNHDKLSREMITDENILNSFIKNEIVSIRENQISLEKLSAIESINNFQEKLLKNKGFALDNKQKELVMNIALSKNDYVVLGKAGAGKTTMMEALKEIYSSQDYEIIGVSISGSASANLEKETGIKSFTIDSLSFKIDNFNQNEKIGLIIVDEAGMLDSKRTAAVKEIAEKLNAKILYIGDTDQLKPVAAGDPFKNLVNGAREKESFGELTEIYRQKNENYKSAVIDSAFGNNKEAFAKLEKLGWVHEISSKAERFSEIRKEYFEAVEKGKDVLVLAHKNSDVNRLNNEIRFEFLRENKINTENQIKIEVKNSNGKVIGEKEFAEGDKIIFLKNSGEIKNGMRAEIVSIDKENNTMKVDIKGFEEKEINFKEYNYLNYGYAMTIHKSQGQTVDKVIFSADKNINSNLFYVGVSRGKEEMSLYLSSSEKEKFLEKIEQSQFKSDILEIRDFTAKEKLKNEKAISEFTDIDKYKNYSAVNDVKTDLQEKSISDFIIYNDGAKEFASSDKENLTEEISKFEHKINENLNPEI
jgi:conjugative relaxase-like TrwC/TraI family protein